MSSESKHDSADDRTLMAEERTFSAWVRTGLTSLATGLGIVKLIPADHQGWMVDAIGILLVIVGGLAFAFGFWGYRRGTRLWQGALPRAVPLWLVGVFSLMLIGVTSLALALILFG